MFDSTCTFDMWCLGFWCLGFIILQNFSCCIIEIIIVISILQEVGKVCVYIYIYIYIYIDIDIDIDIDIYYIYIYIYNIGQIGKSIKPTPTPTPIPKFWKFFKVCTSGCSKNTNTLPGPASFLFSLSKVFQITKVTNYKTLFFKKDF